MRQPCPPCSFALLGHSDETDCTGGDKWGEGKGLTLFVLEGGRSLVYTLLCVLMKIDKEFPDSFILQVFTDFEKIYHISSSRYQINISLSTFKCLPQSFSVLSVAGGDFYFQRNLFTK